MRVEGYPLLYRKFQTTLSQGVKKKKKEKWFNLHKVSRYKNRDS